MDILKQKTHMCAECNGKTFIPAVIFKEVSAFESDSGHEELVPIEVFVCMECTTILNSELFNL